ncbi:alpha/beta hydrolase-fold protein [Undibacterium sp. Di27W]|uniref:alpha/beta hydrolase-fold protein n=1 Tax=Undibacterium sp. Di27W TaxID=3413036 RepID=UPI003BF09413
MIHIRIFVFLLSLLSLVGLVHAEEKSENIIVGTIDTIHSNVLNEDRKIWVHVPKPKAGRGPEKSVYPVVYLLDGSDHFHSMMGLMERLCRGDGYPCPEMILVAVTHNNRTRELTPTKAGSVMAPEKIQENSGGGEAFSAFLEKELIPYINAKYPVAPYRVMVGHSLGGLAVFQTLLHHTKLFDAYLAIDPSLWWDNALTARQMEAAIKDGRLTNKSLYLAVANTLKNGLQFDQARSATDNGSAHIRAMLRVADMLDAQPQKNFHWKWKYYPEENHGSIPVIAEYDALQFLFDFYKIADTERLYDEKVDGALELKQHFEKVSQRLGYQQFPKLSFVNMMGQHFLNEKKLKNAHDFLELNVKNYPNNPLSYEGMGDYYQAAGEQAKAKEAYQQAVNLDANSRAKEKLEKLTK